MVSKEFSEKVNAAIERRKQVEAQNEVKVHHSWHELLSIDENETIKYMLNCSAEQVYWLSEVFEDISERLQSNSFIQCLHDIQKKFPELDLKYNIEWAENFVYSNWCVEENWKVRLLRDRINIFLNHSGNFSHVQSKQEVRYAKIKELLEHDREVTEEYLNSCSVELRATLNTIVNIKA